MAFVDFRSAVENWDLTSPQVKSGIREKFEALPARALDELFRVNPYAKRLYELAVGFKPPPLAPVAVPPKLPPPRVAWSKALEQKLQDIFESTLARTLPPRISPKRFLPDFRLELVTIRQLPTEDEMVRAVEKFTEEIARREAPRPRAVPPRIGPPRFEHPIMAKWEVERLWQEFLAYAKSISILNPEQYGAAFNEKVAEATTYDDAMSLTLELAEELKRRPTPRPPSIPGLPPLLAPEAPLAWIPIEVFPWNFFDWLKLRRGKTINDWAKMMEDEKFLHKDAYKKEYNEYIRKQKEMGLL